MEIRPIASALMRNKSALVLIALQVAITLAIVCNSVFIILERIEKVNRPSGLDEPAIFAISSSGFAPGFDLDGSMRQDLDAIRSTPGIIDATAINSIPLSNGGWSEGVSDKPEGTPLKDRKQESTSVYLVDEHAVKSMGLELVAGRDFTANDVTVRTQEDVGKAQSIIVTQALADRFYPDGAVGKTIYAGGLVDDGRPVTIIGVVKRLQAPWVGWDKVEHSLLVPLLQQGENQARYLIRAEPGQRDRLMPEIEKKLGEINSGRILRDLKSLEEIRGDSYRRDRAMSVILGTVIVALLIVTGLGIVGMASFWVTRRTKQIGTRRALGARRFDVRRYFMVENAIVIAIGLALGVVLTYGFNLWLMQHYELPRLAWYYVPIGIVTMFLLGQVAVSGPAGRASRVSPAVATRSV